MEISVLPGIRDGSRYAQESLANSRRVRVFVGRSYSRAVYGLVTSDLLLLEYIVRDVQAILFRRFVDVFVAECTSSNTAP